MFLQLPWQLSGLSCFHSHFHSHQWLCRLVFLADCGFLGEEGDTKINKIYFSLIISSQHAIPLLILLHSLKDKPFNVHCLSLHLLLLKNNLNILNINHAYTNTDSFVENFTLLVKGDIYNENNVKLPPSDKKTLFPPQRKGAGYLCIISTYW